MASPCMRAVLFRTNHLLGGVLQAAALRLAALSRDVRMDFALTCLRVDSNVSHRAFTK